MMQTDSVDPIYVKRDLLITRFQGFVLGIVQQLMNTMSLPEDMRDEFISAGYLGLVEAAGRFDPNNGVDFRRYAYLRIRGSIIDTIRVSSKLSGKLFKRLKALQARVRNEEQLFEEVHARKIMTSPTQADTKQTKRERILKLLETLTSAVVIHELSGESELEASRRASGDECAEGFYETRQQNSRIRALVNSLPEKEKIIIEEFYFKDRSFAQIARDFDGFSKSWVSRLHARALERLKDKIVALVQE